MKSFREGREDSRRRSETHREIVATWTIDEVPRQLAATWPGLASEKQDVMLAQEAVEHYTDIVQKQPENARAWCILGIGFGTMPPFDEQGDKSSQGAGLFQ